MKSVVEPHYSTANDLLIHRIAVPLLRWRRLTDKSKFELLMITKVSELKINLTLTLCMKLFRVIQFFDLIFRLAGNVDAKLFEGAAIGH